jgi:osmotically-inducible protein OsmY
MCGVGVWISRLSSITADAGKVTFEGIAASTDEQHAVAEVVSQVARVKGVSNKLKVMKDVRIFPSSKI